MRALIVEDEMTSRVILQKILSGFGEVQVCIDGNEAIEAFCTAHDNQTPYDLICMDFMMPEIDGYDALKRIRTIEADKGITPEGRAKVIMTTGLNNIETEYEDIAAMADAILLKPIRKDSFIETLGKLGFSQHG